MLVKFFCFIKAKQSNRQSTFANTWIYVSLNGPDSEQEKVQFHSVVRSRRVWMPRDLTTESSRWWQQHIIIPNPNPSNKQQGASNWSKKTHDSKCNSSSSSLTQFLIDFHMADYQEQDTSCAPWQNLAQNCAQRLDESGTPVAPKSDRCFVWELEQSFW